MMSSSQAHKQVHKASPRSLQALPGEVLVGGRPERCPCSQIAPSRHGRGPWLQRAQQLPPPAARGDPALGSWERKRRGWEKEKEGWEKEKKGWEKGGVAPVHPRLPSRGDEMGKERRFRGCHGSGSMGPWQDSKKYSLQA